MEELVFRIFENRMLRRKFGPKTKKGIVYILHHILLNGHIPIGGTR
jgi:hypothetical protein